MTRTIRIARITCHGTGGLGGRSGGRSAAEPGAGRAFHRPRGARNPPKPSKAEREQAKRAEVGAERLHLAGLTNAVVIIMGVVLGAMVVVLVLVLVSHH
jgi:hypothetical protein